MPYGVLLKQLLKKNKLTYSNLSSKCSEIGVPLNSGYIKEIANGKRNPPTEEKTRAIAKVLNIDERLLILEGYIDKAPTEVLQIFNNMRNLSLIMALSQFENRISQDSISFIKHKFNKIPLAEFLIEILEPQTLNYDSNKKFSLSMEGLNLNINTNNMAIFKVIDSSMSPKLEKNDTVNLEIQEHYSNGDILAVKIHGYNEIIYRMALFNKDIITLVPLNSSFKETAYNRTDIEILGRVSQIIRDL